MVANSTNGIVGSGGLGGVPCETTAARRQTMALVRTACLERWPVTAAMKAKAVEQVCEIAAKAEGDRERLRANEIITAMDRANIEALVALDKLERLDAGENTENITLTLMPPRLARLHANPDTGTE